MTQFVTQLYPLPAGERSLSGLYLAHDLRAESAAAAAPYVYANFVVSLDGRIAIPHPDRPGLTVPKAVANERDWRLFQELAAQADVIISSGRYLRDWADGRAQEILQVDDPRFADLRQWRQDQGLVPQPDIAVLSNSLDFPIPDVLRAGGRRVVVFTGADPDRERVAEIEARAGRVIVAGGERVEGRALVRGLAELGYQTIYSAAGPRICHMLLAAGVLDRLYLTHANRLLGGAPFASIVEGALLEPAADMHINRIYLDPYGVAGQGQLFLSYNREQADDG